MKIIFAIINIVDNDKNLFLINYFEVFFAASVLILYIPLLNQYDHKQEKIAYPTSED